MAPPFPSIRFVDRSRSLPPKIVENTSEKRERIKEEGEKEEGKKTRTKTKRRTAVIKMEIEIDE